MIIILEMMKHKPLQTCLLILTSRFIFIVVGFDDTITVIERPNGFIVPVLVSNLNRKVLIVQINLKYSEASQAMIILYCDIKGFYLPSSL